MSISRVRTVLYKVALILGDISAIIKGEYFRRIVRKAAGRATSRGLSSIFRKRKRGD